MYAHDYHKERALSRAITCSFINFVSAFTFCSKKNVFFSSFKTIRNGVKIVLHLKWFSTGIWVIMCTHSHSPNCYSMIYYAISFPFLCFAQKLCGNKQNVVEIFYFNVLETDELSKFKVTQGTYSVLLTGSYDSKKQCLKVES